MHPADVEQFRLLAASPIRSKEREAALKAWEEYKLSRQAAHIMEKNEQQDSFGGLGSMGMFNKIDYINSLTAPAIDLSGEVFNDVCIGYGDFRAVRFDDVTFDGNTALKGAKLEAASMKRTKLPGALLVSSDFQGADLTGADLSGADLSGSNLADTNLAGCNLSGADLKRVNLVGANVEGAILDDAHVFGVSAWNLRGEPASSKNLVVTPGATTITTDDIQIAQFMYLLLDNPRIRNVLDAVTHKVVLILGRFSPERKEVLDGLRDALREKNLVPILFDFDKPVDRDFTETLLTLAGMAKFIIADLTQPKSSPLESHATITNYKVPFIPIIQEGEWPFSMFVDLQRSHHWVLNTLKYKDKEDLLKWVDKIISRAHEKYTQLQVEKAKEAEAPKSGEDW